MKNILGNLLANYNDNLKDQYETILNVLSDLSFSDTEQIIYFLKSYDIIDETYESSSNIITHIDDFVTKCEAGDEELYKLIVTTILGKQFQHNKPLLEVIDDNTLMIPKTSFIPVKLENSTDGDYVLFYMYTSEDIIIDITDESDILIEFLLAKDVDTYKLKYILYPRTSPALPNSKYNNYVGYIRKENDVIVTQWDINNSLDGIIKYDTNSLLTYFSDNSIETSYNFKNYLVSGDELLGTDFSEKTLNEKEYINLLTKNNTVDKTLNYKVHDVTDVETLRFIVSALTDSTKDDYYTLDFDLVIKEYMNIFNSLDDVIKVKFNDELVDFSNITQIIEATPAIESLSTVHDYLTNSKITTIKNKVDVFADAKMKISSAVTEINDIELYTSNSPSFLTSFDFDGVDGLGYKYYIGFNRYIIFVDDIRLCNDESSKLAFTEHDGTNVIFYCDEDYEGYITNTLGLEVSYVVNKSTNKTYSVSAGKSNTTKLTKINESLDDILMYIKIKNNNKLIEYINCIKSDDNDNAYIDKPLSEIFVNVMSLSNGSIYANLSNNIYTAGDFAYLLQPDLSVTGLADIKDGSPKFDIEKVTISTIGNEITYPTVNEKYTENVTVVDSNGINVVDIYEPDEYIRFRGSNIPTELSIDEYYLVDSYFSDDDDTYIVIKNTLGDIITITSGTYDFIISRDSYSINQTQSLRKIDVVESLSSFDSLIEDDSLKIKDYLKFEEYTTTSSYIQPINYTKTTASELLFRLENNNDILDRFAIVITQESGQTYTEKENLHSYNKPWYDLLNDNYFKPTNNSIYNFLIIRKVSNNSISSNPLSLDYYYKWNGNYYIIEGIRQVLNNDKSNFSVVVENIFEDDEYYMFNEKISVFKTSLLLPIEKKITFPFNSSYEIINPEIDYMEYHYNNYKEITSVNKADVNDVDDVLVKYRGLIFNEGDTSYNYDSIEITPDVIKIVYETNQTNTDTKKIGRYLVDYDINLELYNAESKYSISSHEYEVFGTIDNINTVTATTFKSISVVPLGTIVIDEVEYIIESVLADVYTYSSTAVIPSGDVIYIKLYNNIKVGDLLLCDDSCSVVESNSFIINYTGDKPREATIFKLIEIDKYKYYKNTGDGKYILTTDKNVNNLPLNQLRKIGDING